MFRRDEIKKIEEYFEVFLILFLVGLFLYVIWGFIIPIFLAATIVFLMYKPYQKVLYHIKNRAVSAIFIMIIVFTCILIPLSFLTFSLLGQVDSLISTGNDLTKNINLEDCSFSFCRIIEDNLIFFDMSFDSFLSRISHYLTISFSSIFSSVSRFMINFFVFILAFYFLLVDGEKFLLYIRKIIPMKEEYKIALFHKFKDVSKSVFTDSIFVAILQGSLVGLGLYFCGFSNTLFWSVVASFFSLIPFLGTTIIWIPAVIYLFLTGKVLTAILLSIYCIIIVGLSDNVLRAVLLNHKTKIHPFIVLISILGGLQVFGFFGIFFGPIIASLLITVLQLYKLDLNKWG